MTTKPPEAEPEIAIEKLVGGLLDGSIGAITLDTSAFKREGLKLESGRLALLSQFSTGNVKLVLADVVVRELVKHLGQKTSEARDSVKSALTQARDFLGLSQQHSIDAAKMIDPGIDPHSLASARVGAYIRTTGAIEVKAADYPIMQDLVDGYFDVVAPFEDKKKEEFPDAIALLSLESWSKDKPTKTLAVSQDGGWKKFCAASQHLIAVPDVATILTILDLANKRTLIGDAISRFVADQMFDRSSALFEEVTGALRDQTHAIQVDDEVNSDVHSCDLDSYDIELKETTFENEDAENKITVFEISHNRAVVEIELNLKLYVTGRFTLSVWDSIDRELIKLATQEAVAEASSEASVLIYLAGDTASGPASLAVEKVELLPVWVHADFGYINAFSGTEREDEHY